MWGETLHGWHHKATTLYRPNLRAPVCFQATATVSKTAMFAILTIMANHLTPASAGLGFVRGSTAKNCEVVEGERAGYLGARELCASREGAGLPIVRSPRDNRALRALLNASNASGAGAWIGLDDIDRIPIREQGGGWKWTDGNFVGRQPSVGDHYNGRPNTLTRDDITYYRGFHAWNDGEPARTGNVPNSESGLCAWMDAGSGNWSASSCDANHTIVCCTPPTPSTFECSENVVAESEEWPLVPFYYRDSTTMDDIPNSAAEIAKGFSNQNAYYIGNEALVELEIQEAQLCVEDLAAEKRLCLPLEHRESQLRFDGTLGGSVGGVGAVLEGLEGNSMHTFIAILSGQIPDGQVGDFTIMDFATLWGKNAGEMVSTKPNTCAQPQSTVFGEPMHCWVTVLSDVPFYWQGEHRQQMGNSLGSTSLYQMGAYQGNWEFRGHGVKLSTLSKTDEIDWFTLDSGARPNGAMCPWDVVYVRAKGQCESPAPDPICTCV